MESDMSGRKRIWIDLDNSPHVPFFAPIVKELERLGYSLTITARDAYQVCELADFHKFSYQRVGRHYGKNKALKVLGTCLRALQLLSIAAKAKPDLAISHGSRSQVLVSGLLRIPSLVIMDYEFTQGSVVFKPNWVMVPEVITKVAFKDKEGQVLHYPGIKEDVYVPSFRPDSSIRARLGLNETDVVVALRPPATEAHYHTARSDELFTATMELLGQAAGVRVILLPRNAKQAASVRASWPKVFSAGKIIIPDQAEDGLNVIWHSDLVISGGGTMNREAAALGVPVYSIFRGQIGAVDRYLAKEGRLTLLESAQDVRTKIVLRQRTKAPPSQNGKSATLDEIVRKIVTIVESTHHTAHLRSDAKRQEV